jgi:hypothetical protein
MVGSNGLRVHQRSVVLTDTRVMGRGDENDGLKAQSYMQLAFLLSLLH